jgi:hypothetical protein
VILNVVGSPEVQPLGGVSVEVLDAPARPSKFDLTLTAREWDGVLQLEMEFDADRYEPAMMGLLLEHVTALLRAASDDPQKGILDHQLPPSSEAEAPAVAAAPPDVAVAQVAHDADRIAVSGRDGDWTYRRLDATAGRVARALAERFPPVADHHLGIVWRPSASFVAAVLGCVRAGAPYSVVDAATGALPGFSAVLDVRPPDDAPDTTLDLRTVLGDDADPPPAARAVGAPAPAPRPPGRDWAVARYGFGAGDRFAVLSGLPEHLLSAMSSAFDAGATLVLPEQSFADDPGAILAWLKTAEVSVAYLTPPILRAMTARPEPLPSLRHVFVDNSGDFVAPDVVALRRLSPTCRIVGLYRVGRDGRPAAASEVPADWTYETAPLRMPIGSEVHDGVRLRHPGGPDAATGEVAELRLGAYRTGDLGRRWSDGTIEFVGGLGTDPSADPVETIGALRGLPDVDDALVAEFPEPDGGSALVGYVAVPDGGFDAAAAHPQLAIRLPDHLVPRRLVVLDRLPLTPAGDYDLDALPYPDADSSAVESHVAPRTPLEQQLAGILRELLAVDRIGVHDSFFELGGFSLLATQLNSRIRESVQVQLTLRDIFESATVEVLAQRIVRAQAEQAGAENVEALLEELETA